MTPTKQELEAQLQRWAAIIDKSLERASRIVDAAANDPEELKKQLQLLAEQSTTQFKKRKLALEIGLLKLRLKEIERRIAQKREEVGETSTRSESTG